MTLAQTTAVIVQPIDGEIVRPGGDEFATLLPMRPGRSVPEALLHK